MVEHAKARFGHFGFQVTTGTSYLGGFIGSVTKETSHIQAKVREWATIITHLSSIARLSPQAAFYTFQHSYQHEWQYLQSVVSDMVDHVTPIETYICTVFLPDLLGGTTSTTIPLISAPSFLSSPNRPGLAFRARLSQLTTTILHPACAPPSLPIPYSTALCPPLPTTRRSCEAKRASPKPPIKPTPPSIS